MCLLARRHRHPENYNFPRLQIRDTAVQSGISLLLGVTATPRLSAGENGFFFLFSTLLLYAFADTTVFFYRLLIAIIASFEGVKYSLKNQKKKNRKRRIVMHRCKSHTEEKREGDFFILL